MSAAGATYVQEMEPLPGADPAQTRESATTSSPRPRGTIAGTIALLLVAVISFLPTNFVVESPGPVVNTLGELEGHQLLSIKDAKTFETESQLDMTTVYVQGGGQHRVTVPVILEALVNPTKDVVQEETVLPRGVTSDELSQQNDSLMASSQELSVAAALNELQIPFTTTLQVVGFGNPLNQGALREGDELEKINGEPIQDLAQLKQALTRQGTKPSTLTVKREGQSVDEEVSTAAAEDGTRQIGVFLKPEYTFPMDVNFGVEDIGGPSAGMMFALAIIDQLTEGSLAGDTHVAGTGAITDDGKVEPIGGIAQKMAAAQRAGAEVFLAPADNCPDVQDRVPKDLDVVKVSTLAEARQALSRIASGTDPQQLPTCTLK